MSVSHLLLLVGAVLMSTACDGGGEVTQPRRHVVEIRGFEYGPAELDLAEGDTVVWINRDAVPHTATSAAGDWDSGSVPAGGSWEVVIAGVGSHDYTCAFHPSMTGKIAAN